MSELKPIGPYLADLTASSAGLPSLGEQDRKLSLAVNRAELLFRCYPKTEADDPETFAAAASAVLARYPDEVIIKVTDPVDGIASRQKWRPHLAEIREACEAEMAPVYREQERQNRLKETMLVMRDAETPREARATLDELRAKHGPNWGLKIAEEDAEAKRKNHERLAGANRTWFARECEAAGVDPARGYSPSLAAIIKGT